VIDAVLAKRHTLAIMPTGAGKSPCYQVPAMLMPGMAFGSPTILALTATATPDVIADIERQLNVGPYA
jgi:ATP-dependent DNA helicase RecQ